MLNAGDTAFLMMCTAMVCLMTPALAFFYGGLVRKTDILTIMFQTFVCLGLVAVIWVLGGFSLVFGPDLGQIIGNRRSKIYAWPGCGTYDKMAPENRVLFPSREAADQQGYRVARNCP